MESREIKLLLILQKYIRVIGRLRSRPSAQIQLRIIEGLSLVFLGIDLDTKMRCDFRSAPGMVKMPMCQ